ncbi:MAG: J domain-containing protein [Oceanobacter sp.]
MKPTDQRHHFHTLGLKPGASLDQVRAAYQRLSLAFHPDRHPELGASGFMKIQQAYQALTQVESILENVDPDVETASAQKANLLENRNRRSEKRRGSPSNRRFESISEPDYKGTRLKVCI